MQDKNAPRDPDNSKPTDDAAEHREAVVLDVPPEERQSALPFPIVGIGASAGGLEAFVELLGKTPADTGMAFVILSHLPIHHPNLLPEILGRAPPMQVHEIGKRMHPKPNNVYVI